MDGHVSKERQPKRWGLLERRKRTGHENSKFWAEKNYVFVLEKETLELLYSSG
jgi:hypothetical protein